MLCIILSEEIETRNNVEGMLETVNVNVTR